MRSHALGLLLMASATARADVAPPEPKVVITWQAGGGWTTLTVDANAHAHYEFHATGWGAPADAHRSADAQLPADGLSRLHALLKANDVCNLRGKPRHPVPEERSATLTLDFSDVRCTVRMLDGQWRESPQASACAVALDAVSAKLDAAARAAPQPSIAGTWRNATVEVRVDLAGPAGVRVRYRESGRELPVREARWEPGSREFSFLLPGHGQPAADDRTGAATVELHLSDDGTRLDGRIVAMRVRTLSLNRAAR